jgi:transcriptional regulator with XRE-family HTH domain
MARLKKTFLASRLRFIKRMRGLSFGDINSKMKEALADKTTAKYGVDKWHEGSGAPKDMELVEALAAACNVPVDFFFQTCLNTRTEGMTLFIEIPDKGVEFSLKMEW